MVSVIVPTHNRRNTLLRALESVRLQTHKDWELIVVDDGSQDDSTALVEAWIEEQNLGHQARVLSHTQNQGVSAARNAGAIPPAAAI